MLTDPQHPKAKEAKDSLFIKLGDTLKRKLMQKNINNAAELWSFLSAHEFQKFIGNPGSDDC